MKASNDIVFVCVVLCVTYSYVGGCEIYLLRDAVDYYVLVVNVENDSLKITNN